MKLSLCGGEPFVRKDIDQIIRVWVKHAQPAVVDIPTNGSFPKRIAEKCEIILKENPDITLDIQLSVDGTEEQHDNIRKIKGLYQRVLESYSVLVELRKKYPNLKIKLNLVYIPENEKNVLNNLKHFSENFDFDRVQMTFPHGMKVKEAYIEKLNFEKFYKLTRNTLRTKIRKRFDIHTMIFRSVKMVRDEFLRNVIREQNMGAHCNAGKSIVVIDDEGKVFPCEPLWESVGALREYDYDIKAILKNQEMEKFSEKYLGDKKCHCTWGSVALTNIVQNPKYLPKLARNFVYFLLTGGKKLDRSNQSDMTVSASYIFK